MPVTVGYWNVAGLAEPIRLILEYVGSPYEDKRYEFGSTPETLLESWYKEKFTLNLDFPNEIYFFMTTISVIHLPSISIHFRNFQVEKLPYYIDGDVRITQSGAILRYLARKHDLLGATEADRIRTDMSEQQAIDFRTAFGRMLITPDFEEAKKTFITELPDKLRPFDAFLGGKFDWFGGSSVTVADFVIYTTLRFIRLFEKQSLDSFEHLKAFMERFEALPRVSEYIKSDKFRKTRPMSPIAKWGNFVPDD